jgi:RimJ/RimL family protein N-acetyltransferase
VITIAENQRSISKELNHLGLIDWIGDENEVGVEAMTEALSRHLDRGLDPDWSRRCMDLVDGLGAQRVADILVVKPDTPLTVRRAGGEDEALVLEWANDALTRRNAFNPERISAATHQAWFRDRLRCQDSCRFYIIGTRNGVPLGQVRFECREHGWEISYVLSPYFRGRGLGRSLLAAALDQFKSELPSAKVFGRVKPANVRSVKVFEALAFDRAAESDDVLVFEKTFE